MIRGWQSFERYRVSERFREPKPQLSIALWKPLLPVSSICRRELGARVRLVFVVQCVDLTDMDQVVSEPRTKQVTSSEGSKLRMIVDSLPVHRGQSSQPLDRSGAFTCESVERLLHVAGIKTISHD